MRQEDSYSFSIILFSSIIYFAGTKCRARRFILFSSIINLFFLSIINFFFWSSNKKSIIDSPVHGIGQEDSYSFLDNIIFINDFFFQYTVSGKKVEVAVRKSIHGVAVDNTSSLADPSVLRHYRDIKELQDWLTV